MSLRAWRHGHGLTQAQAAQLLGVATITYQKYEAGHRYPRREPVKRIAKLTGIPVAVLAGVA